MWVHIAGEVVQPGPYRVAIGAELADLIDLAGGFTGSADRESLSLTRQLREGEEVIVPRRGIPGGEAGDSRGMVDLNSACEEELQELTGIGPVLAERIVDHRQAHGDFQEVEELLAIEGIGPVTLENLRPNIIIR